ncbi:MAG: insulinase family protein [Spirochaetota bacterium]
MQSIPATISAALLAAVLSSPLFCAPIGSGKAGMLDASQLSSGLELVIMEDHSSPFARVDLVIRGGAEGQTAETAGYFHILEHLLLDHQEGATTIAERVKALAPPSWSAETSAEYMAFRMSVLSSDIGEGISIWADMVAVESFSADELDAARQKSMVEAERKFADPDGVYEGIMTKRLFSRFPWRRDPAGSEKILRNATPEALSRLKLASIGPGNSILIVAGDVDPKATRIAAESAFGKWKGNPAQIAPTPHPKLGVARPTWFFLSDPSVPEGMAVLEIRYRGPDMSTDIHAANAADLWAAMADSADGRLMKALVAAVPTLRAQPPPTIQFLGQRSGSTLSVFSMFDLGIKPALLKEVQTFKETFRGIEVTAMRANPGYFIPEEYASARDSLVAERNIALGSVESFCEEVEYAWTASTLDWFSGYASALEAIGPKEVAAFLDTWILRNLEAVALRLNPKDAEREAKSLAGGGFEADSAKAAFWWQSK